MSIDRIQTYLRELALAGIDLKDKSLPTSSTFTQTKPKKLAQHLIPPHTSAADLSRPAQAPQLRKHQKAGKSVRPTFKPASHEVVVDRIRTLDNVLAQSMIWLRDNHLELAPNSSGEREHDKRELADLVPDRDPVDETLKWSDLKAFKLLGDENTRRFAGKKYMFRALEVAETSQVDLEIRRLAIEYSINIQSVERIRKTFDMFDGDGSGSLESEEIKPLILSLLKVKNPEDFSKARLEFLARQFLGKSQKCDFKTFFDIYIRMFGDQSAPERAFYAALNPLHDALATIGS
jgi:hypothetical protein